MNTFGNRFRISIFGESHGPCAGVLIDGCPAGIPLVTDDFAEALSRRRGGTRKGTTPRSEEDQPEFLSGVYNGFTTGFPIAIITRNRNTVSSAYDLFKDTPRPGHADYVAEKKFKGFADMRGSGHFSGRLTFGLVAAGVVAKKLAGDISVEARLLSVGGQSDIDSAINKAMEENDSVGGTIECVAKGVRVGVGEPFFYSLESALSQLAFSIPAIKGIEFGAGFRAASMRGSEHNDAFIDANGTTSTNNTGGINGGISNGNDIVFRLAVKPTSSIGRPQTTYNFASNKMGTLQVEGRHDACIALRIPVVAESITYIALADLMAY